jgi:hypothetical protein
MFEERREEDAFGMGLPYVSSAASSAAAGTAAFAAGGGPGELSAPVQRLLEAVPAVLAQVPVELPGPLALADTAALLQAVEQLHAAVLGRVADVDARKLHALDGAASTGSWVAQQQTSLDRGELALALRLDRPPPRPHPQAQRRPMARPARLDHRTRHMTTRTRRTKAVCGGASAPAAPGRLAA